MSVSYNFILEFGARTSFTLRNLVWKHIYLFRCISVFLYIVI